MRVARAASLATPAAILASCTLAASTSGRAAAVGARAFTAGRLPAPITITTGHITARIGRDGRITRVPNPRPLVPMAADWFPGTGTWYAIQRKHLVVGRGPATLWRSRGLFPSRWRGVVAAGRQGVAFSYHQRLYVARLGGAERPVARGEGAQGWTRGGIYTYGGRGNAVRLRSVTGRLIATVARRPAEHVYDSANGSFYMIIRGALLRARGARAQRVASLAALGLPPGNTWMQPLGGLVELMSPDRLTVLRPDGSTYASTPLPRTGGQTDTISGGPTVAPRQAAVAFTAAAGLPEDPGNALHAHGTETVYLLRPGARSATAIHTEAVAFRACERGAEIQWHGVWLLYGNSEGNVVAIDATGVHRAIDLTQPADRVLGTHSGVSADWSGQPPER